jgi:SseB protein N-terminal domain
VSDESVERPQPGSHDRSTPTGSLETSSANLFAAMQAARDAQERAGGDTAALGAFYRTLMSGTVLLPVPPSHGDEAKAALASAVDDDEEVEISVMLARDGAGNPVNVLFGSVAALAAWSPPGTANLPIPARIAFTNLASNGLPAILDPAGPIPYEFTADEVGALAAGRLPGGDEPLFEATRRSSLALRLPGAETLALEATLAHDLAGSAVETAYLVEAETNGVRRLLLGLVGGEDASATVDVPDGTDVVWLEEPLLSGVRGVADPFYRRGAR